VVPVARALCLRHHDLRTWCAHYLHLTSGPAGRNLNRDRRGRVAAFGLVAPHDGLFPHFSAGHGNGAARVELQISKYHAFHYLGTPSFDW